MTNSFAIRMIPRSLEAAVCPVGLSAKEMPPAWDRPCADFGFPLCQPGVSSTIDVLAMPSRAGTLLSLQVNATPGPKPYPLK